MTWHIAFFTAIHFIHAVGSKNSNAKSCQLLLVRTVSTRIVHPGSHGCYSFPAGFAAMLTPARGSKSAMWNVTSTSIATIPLCGFSSINSALMPTSSWEFTIANASRRRSLVKDRRVCDESHHIKAHIASL